MDYREHTGRYDRVVSVGMFEHVGKRNYISNRRALLFTGGNRVVVGQSFKRVRSQVIGSIVRG